MADRITVIGNIGQDPIRKSTSKGDLLQFSVAHNTKVQDEGGGVKDGETVWYRVSAWDALGANAAVSLRRGQRVIVHGWMKPNTWTGQDGVERTSLDLKATAIGHDLTSGTSTFVKGGVAAASAAATPTGPAATAPAPTAPAPGDWGAQPTEPALIPALVPMVTDGWSTVYDAESETPF